MLLFPRVVLGIFFTFLLICGVLGVGLLGLWSWIGFLSLGFQLIRFGACGVGLSGFFHGVGARNIFLEK